MPGGWGAPENTAQIVWMVSEILDSSLGAMRGGPITNLYAPVSGLATWDREVGERDGEYIHGIHGSHSEGWFLRVPEGPEGFLGGHFRRAVDERPRRVFALSLYFGFGYVVPVFLCQHVGGRVRVLDRGDGGHDDHRLELGPGLQGRVEDSLGPVDGGVQDGFRVSEEERDWGGEVGDCCDICYMELAEKLIQPV